MTLTETPMRTFTIINIILTAVISVAVIAQAWFT